MIAPSWKPKIVDYAFAVTGEEGSTYAWYVGGGTFEPGPSVVPSMVDGTFPPSGILRGVDVRLHDSGGWTFSEIRVRCIEPISPAIFGGLYENLPVTSNHNGRYLFDSGTLTADLTASDTDCFVRERFGQYSEPFGSWFAVVLDWNTSAGSGTSQLTVSLHLEEAVP